MNTKQLTHQEVPLKKPALPVVLVCDGITGPANAGALIRLSDAFGVGQLVFCGREINLSGNRLKKTSRSAEKYVSIVQQRSALPLLQELKSQGFILAGLEITSSSVAVQDFIAPCCNGIALILGNERDGIAPGTLALLDVILHITMFGHNSSMNVSHAAAIALHELTKPNPHEK